jgi:hypothetical protein
MIMNTFLAFLIFFLTHILLIRRNKNRDQYVAFIFSSIISILFLINFAKDNNTEELFISTFFLSSCILGIFWFYYTFPTGLSSRLLYMMNKKINNKEIINKYKKDLITSRIKFLEKNKFIKKKNNFLFSLWRGKIISKSSLYINFVLNKK